MSPIRVSHGGSNFRQRVDKLHTTAGQPVMNLEDFFQFVNSHQVNNGELGYSTFYLKQDIQSSMLN